MSSYGSTIFQWLWRWCTLYLRKEFLRQGCHLDSGGEQAGCPWAQVDWSSDGELLAWGWYQQVASCLRGAGISWWRAACVGLVLADCELLAWGCYQLGDGKKKCKKRKESKWVMAKRNARRGRNLGIIF